MMTDERTTVSASLPEKATVGRVLRDQRKTVGVAAALRVGS